MNQRPVNNIYQVFKKASRLWQYMNQRCRSSNNTGFIYYGAKGIGVEMSFDEFMYWFVGEAKYVDLDQISVSRIDHERSYCLSNIKLESISDNTKERLLRRGNPSPWKKKKVVIISEKKTHICESVSEASRITLVDASDIVKICKGKMKRGVTKSGYSFQYAEDLDAPV